MMLIVIPVLLICYYGFLLRYIYRYRLSPTALEGRWLGIRTLHVPYAKMESIDVLPFSETLGFGFATTRAGNRFGGLVVLVRRRAAWGKNVLVTPDEPVAFAGELRRRVGL